MTFNRKQVSESWFWQRAGKQEIWPSSGIRVSSLFEVEVSEFLTKQIVKEWAPKGIAAEDRSIFNF